MFLPGLHAPTNVAALYAGEALPYAVNGNDPALVADFAGSLNSGTPYFRQGGSVSTFSDIFTYTGASLGTMTDSSGNLVWKPHNLINSSANLASSWFNNGTTDSGQVLTASAGAGVHHIYSANSHTSASRPYRIQASITPGTHNYVYLSFYRNGSNHFGRVFDLSDGTEGQTNQLNYSLTSSSITDNGDGSYTLTIIGSVDPVSNSGPIIAFAQAKTGNSFDTSTGAPTWTASGTETITINWVSYQRFDLDGVANNPDTGNSHVPTSGSPVYLPRRLHYRASTLKGIRNETAAATNLLHTTGTLVTQSVTVSAVAHTLHFTGTGTVTLSGASTAGPLVGTGAGEDNRVSLTFTPSAGSLTLTVSGTVSNAQLEVGSVRSSYIPNLAGSGTVTRAAETLTAAGANLDASTTAMSFHLEGEENYADLATAGQVDLFDWRADANNRITVTIDTDGAKTGTITLTMVNGGSSASVSASSELTPGVNKAFNVAWRVTGSEINIALDGTAATAVSTAIGVPDLSSASAAFEGRGSRSIFRQAAADWTDSGIEAAST